MTLKKENQFSTSYRKWIRMELIFHFFHLFFHIFPHLLKGGKQLFAIRGKRNPLIFKRLVGQVRNYLLLAYRLLFLILMKDIFQIFFAHNSKMNKIKATIDKVAKTDITVLIKGESGTGKELLAQAIHLNSHRKDKPFIKVNCATIPKGLLESELFGFEKGAFTGAHLEKPGKFELANGGTILLNDIGEIDISIQAKLLQVLQDGMFSRFGRAMEMLR